MSDNKGNRSFSLGLILAFVVLTLDQVSKWWVVTEVMNPPRFIPVFPSFNLVMGWNRGVSFGIFDSDSPPNQWLLIALALVVVTVLLVWLKRDDSRLVSAALGMIVGGALGNVIDRIHYGAVADFLDFYVGDFHWPAFNVADTGITIGVVVLVLESFFVGSKTDKTDKKDADDGGVGKDVT
jgi:signal peptidase II